MAPKDILDDPLKKKRGRPIKSLVRQRIVDILYYMDKGTGYDIFKIYRAIFDSVNIRLIYYHLKKGMFTHEFNLFEQTEESGNYSWGTSAEKIYYCLGPNAHVTNNMEVRVYFDQVLEDKVLNEKLNKLEFQ